MLLRALVAAILVAVPAAGRADATSDARTCIKIQNVTAFAPRGQIYVELGAACTEDDFDLEDPLLAYLEVLVASLPPVGEDVRVYSHEPRRRQTLVFRDLPLRKGQVVLVRLVRFGEILGLKSIKVP